MTPFCTKLWKSPLLPKERHIFAEFLMGAQFFDCRALQPLLSERAKHDPGEYIHEMFQAEMPAESTCLEFFDGYLVAIRDYRIGAQAFRCLVIGNSKEKVELFEFTIDRDSNITPIGDYDQSFGQHTPLLLSRVDNVLRCAWFCIEAMQTPGGLCHEIQHRPTRQQARSHRHGRPIHKWVEIKLGRPRKLNEHDNKGECQRTVAWHYRRGHRVNHPNPNYPKWRKGCWAGSPEAGIRSHTYVVEVPA